MTATRSETPGATAGWPSGTMTAAMIAGPHRLVHAALPIPGPAPGQVLVRPRHVGICGTDLELLHGTAAYFRDGRARYPHVFGHEWWGEVVATESPEFAVGEPVVGHTMVPCGLCQACRRGRRQLCRRLREVGLYHQQGAAAGYIRLPAPALTRLPASLAVPWAVLVEPAVTVVEALRRTECGLDDRVAVLGTGTIGLLAVQLAGRLAGRVEAIGVDPGGLALAARCGAEATHFADAAPAGAYSLVVEASGAAGALANAVALAEDGGRVALVGVSGEPEGGLVPGDLALRGITVHGIRHGLDHYERTVRLFADGVLDGGGLVAEVVPIAAAARAFELMAHGRSGPPKVILELGVA